jgi:polyhydroxyalkanoate synthase subunit PhaC
MESKRRDAPKDIFELVDRLYQSYLAQTTAGISPAAIRTACFAWVSQLSQSPGHVLKLATYIPTHAGQRINKIFTESQPDNGNDVRFSSNHWQWLPWRCFAENFLFAEDWWHHATHNVPGLPKHTERVISFMARQWLDALSPANFVLTNPDLLHETIRSGGQNLIRGTYLCWKDVVERVTNAPMPGIENFTPGKQVAVTPGKVIFQNHLIEVIQYEAQTDTVYKEPILMIPAWIMKYYILDLSPHNSLVKWLVSQGHTVFIVSWRNPTQEDRYLDMDDYFRLGAMAAIDAVAKARPRTKIHLMGYCLGGTLAMITAAAMSRMDDQRLQSLTLIAAQGDFTEAGELMLFINQSELSFLKNMMWHQGYLDTKQMSGSFQMLRSYDLIWSKMIQDYMHGEERGMILRVCHIKCIVSI